MFAKNRPEISYWCNTTFKGAVASSAMRALAMLTYCHCNQNALRLSQPSVRIFSEKVKSTCRETLAIDARMRVGAIRVR